MTKESSREKLKLGVLALLQKVEALREESLRGNPSPTQLDLASSFFRLGAEQFSILSKQTRAVENCDTLKELASLFSSVGDTLTVLHTELQKINSTCISESDSLSETFLSTIGSILNDFQEMCFHFGGYFAERVESVRKND